MKKAILIEVEQAVIGAPPRLTVTPQGEIAVMEGIAMCNAAVNYFLQAQTQFEQQMAAEMQARADGNPLVKQ